MQKSLENVVISTFQGFFLCFNMCKIMQKNVCIFGWFSANKIGSTSNIGVGVIAPIPYVLYFA